MGGESEPSSSYGSKLSTSSSESMVQIRRTRPEKEEEEERAIANHRLLYSKSKVYVNPTPYTRDNIPGFVALVRKDGVNPTYLLAWIPEGLLDQKGRDEWDKFLKVEEKAPLDDDEGMPLSDAVLIDPPVSRPEYYAFSVPLSSIYSLIALQPSLSSWHGSITINLIHESTLPTLHFHDDESRSIQLPSPSNNPGTYPPSYPPVSSKTSWGGESLIAGLRAYANVVRSSLDPTLFLVDPSRQDIEAHSVVLFSDDAVDSIISPSSSPIPLHRRPRPLSSPPTATRRRTSVLHASLAPSPSASILQSFSSITRATRHAAQQILSHPLAKPIVPHLPDPVRSLVNVNGEWSSWVEKGGMGEFESARVYLARWARIVAEEGERSRLREALPITGAQQSDDDSETSSLGIFELIHSTSNLPIPRPTRNPRHPVDAAQWDAWFNKDGRPRVSKEEMRAEVFRRGTAYEIRRKVWPYILDVLTWDASTEEREMQWKEKQMRYQEIYNEWCGVEEVFNREDVVEERHRIDVDCRRTDRNQLIFAAQAVQEQDAGKPDPPSHKRYSSMSPNQDDIGAQSPSNEHVERLSAILLTYNFYERELGYVQGMSDLCAPIYIVMGADQEMTFWCFVQVMERMKKNFLRDQSGMKKQLLTLQQLLAVMDPQLYRHLEKVDGLNLFFCFRWVLIAFKREFLFEDVLRLWEALWTDYYGSQFVLFVALAVLESHRDVILRYLVEFDEILKYCNELSMTIELDSTLAQAEVLYLSFAQLVADIDRRQTQGALDKLEGLRRRSGGRTLDAAPLNLPLISEYLRELLT
ncbi:RabGAP/TBC [Ramaria rubella]|nr:RabGAP/TBC [Ramaria rubella]